MENLIPLFIALTGAAVLLQACLLAAIYLSMRKTSSKLEALATEVKSKIVPAIDNVQAFVVQGQTFVVQAQTFVTEMRPKVQVIADKVDVIADNVSNTTATVRSQVQRVDATVNDVVDRARLQVIRADDMMTRTMDRVEHTSEIVHRTVVSPVRQVSGIIQGVTTGIEVLIGRGRKNGRTREARPSVQQDEMFI